MSNFDVLSGRAADDENKPRTPLNGLLPRNYTGRRQLIVAGTCFFVVLVFLQMTNSQDGKQQQVNANSTSSRYRFVSVVVRSGCWIMAWLGVGWLLGTCCLGTVHGYITECLGL